MQRNQTAASRVRISGDELSVFLGSCPPGSAAVVRALRSVVLTCAPRAVEAIRFGSLCYFEPAARFGAIGGNICMIEAHPDGTRLSFIQGAGLRDPARLLLGSSKAKRYVVVRTQDEARRSELRTMVRESALRAKQAAEDGLKPVPRPRRPAPRPRGSPPR